VSEKRKRFENKKKLVAEVCGLLEFQAEKTAAKTPFQKRMEEFQFTIEARLHAPK